ncbi:MAG: tRNA lysidine(34) synthetase TilS [Yoonia sp.]|uniref:tRNA lysidine(34) synthetase TilS n=1 Tax=Yoonia sp. TaxID=2212373 RepID=UPI00273EFCA1|nr:tRNA lysidine(34) synthetase TilS [Yoonia sp.]MDP5085837.1 tRNA lysidine(34) synthetase TilS [Yoonia sp.]
MSVGSDPAATSARFRAALAQHADTFAKHPIGLSVSGGGDSIALMHLAVKALGPQAFRAITINHGLRPEAVDEIALVAKQAQALGVPHTVVQWTWDGTGNLQAAARNGRWAAIREWAFAYNIRSVWLGHTEDDQLETVLMRLARGSGIDGLMAMAQVTQRDELTLMRPLLGIARSDLRTWLKAERIAWADDPSNDDPRFDRVRARQMFGKLEELGLTRKRLLQTVDHMQAAHMSLQIAARQFARAHVQQDAGDLIFSQPALDLEKEDAPRRVMAAAFGWVGSKTYRPRFEQLLEVVGKARKGLTVTLGGCIMSPESDGRVRLTREAAATVDVIRSNHPLTDAMGVFWDTRWFLEGPLGPDLCFRALGEGIRHCPDWRTSGTPRTSLLASPSVWRGDSLIAAPLAGLSSGWSARIVADFHSVAFAIED